MPRVGLVLGGGGIQGAVWLEGALAALAAEIGWSPADAEIVVGTSAGAWLATLLAAGVPPWLMAAQSEGHRIDGLIPGRRRDEPADEDGTPAAPAWLRGPGSSPLLLRASLPPWSLSGTHALTGLLPRGRRSSGVQELVRLVVPSGWPAHRNLWCVACDYRTGERVVFTPRDGGAADVADAVAASCAVPAYYRPVPIAGREYVDGGVHSVSNLDLLSDRGLDLVICLNPTSSLDAMPGLTPAQLAWRYVRQSSGRHLGSEARHVRRGGTRVLLVQPTRRDIEVMGANWLRASHHPEIIGITRSTVAQQLRQSPLADLLEALPRSEPHMVRRPKGPPSSWPALTAPPAWAA